MFNYTFSEKGQQFIEFQTQIGYDNFSMEFQNPSFILKILESESLTLDCDEESQNDSIYNLCIKGKKQIKVLLQD